MARPHIRRVLRYLGITAAAVDVGIQLVPVNEVGSNPPEHFNLEAPSEVEALLRRVCFDCHTNETKWPVYSRIAPGSWLATPMKMSVNPIRTSTVNDCPGT